MPLTWRKASGPDRGLARAARRVAASRWLRLLVGLEVLGGVAVPVSVRALVGGGHRAGGRAARRPEVAVAAVLAALAVVDLAVAFVAVAEALDRVARGGRSAREHRLHAAVAHHAGAGGDQLADDDVLLQAHELVALALDRRLGEHPGGLLERGRRQPRLGRQRRLGDAEQLGTSVGGGAATLERLAVGALERRPLDQLAGEQARVAALQHGHALQHLPDDQLDVLVVDGHTLRGVDLLDLLDQVALRGPDAEHPQHLLGVGHTVDDGLADVDLLAVLDPQARAARHDRLPLLALVRGDRHLDALVDLLDGDPAGELRDRRHALWRAGLEQLLDTRQTVGDVLAGDATGVEGPHGELRARLADRLGGDDADRLADVDQPVGGQAAAVAE